MQCLSKHPVAGIPKVVAGQLRVRWILGAGQLGTFKPSKATAGMATPVVSQLTQPSIYKHIYVNICIYMYIYVYIYV